MDVLSVYNENFYHLMVTDKRQGSTYETRIYIYVSSFLPFPFTEAKFTGMFVLQNRRQNL